jgi:hypothetical protein
MLGIKGHDYTWRKSWIEFKAPDAPGVYCLRDKECKVLFIGKGKVRERLLSHWNRENSTDGAGAKPVSVSAVTKDLVYIAKRLIAGSCRTILDDAT